MQDTDYMAIKQKKHAQVLAKLRWKYLGDKQVLYTS
jgi:hypothetical protein